MHTLLSLPKFWFSNHCVSQTYSRQEISYFWRLEKTWWKLQGKSQTAKHTRHLLQEKTTSNFCIFLHHFQNHWWQRPVWIKLSRSCLAISDHKFWPASWALAWFCLAQNGKSNLGMIPLGKNFPSPILPGSVLGKCRGKISRVQSWQDPSPESDSGKKS